MHYTVTEGYVPDYFLAVSCQSHTIRLQEDFCMNYNVSWQCKAHMSLSYLTV